MLAADKKGRPPSEYLLTVFLDYREKDYDAGYKPDKGQEGFIVRRRMLNPEFFTDPDIVAHFDAYGRLFYQGLWCVAEDSGVFEPNPLALKMKIFPGDDISLERIQEYLGKLKDLGKTIPYEANGREYHWLKNFFKHQKLDRPSPPTIPLPPWVIWDDSAEKRHQWFYKVNDNAVSTKCRGTVAEQSATCRPEENRKEVNRKEVNITPVCSAHDVNAPVHLHNDYPADFEEFWSRYPSSRRKEKKAAYRAWKARIKAGAKPEQLITAAALYAQECKGKDPRYIKLPKTFLGPDAPWEEYLQPRGAPENKYTHVHPASDLQLATARKTLILKTDT